MVARHTGPDRPRIIVSNGIEITSNARREWETEWHDIAPDLRPWLPAMQRAQIATRRSLCESQAASAAADVRNLRGCRAAEASTSALHAPIGLKTAALDRVRAMRAPRCF